MTILNGKPDDVELWPQNFTWASGHSQDGERAFMVLGIETDNLGNFNVPLNPAAAQHLVCNLTQWLLQIMGHSHE